MFESISVGAPAAVLSAEPAGPRLAGLLAEVSRADSRDEVLIETLRAVERMSSWLAAVQVDVLAELARRRPPDPRDPAPDAADARSRHGGSIRLDGPRYSVFTADEVAAALGWSWYAADQRLRLAVDLSTRLPHVADALAEGHIDLGKARVISDCTRGLGDEAAFRVADAAVRQSTGRTVGQVRAQADRMAIAADPELARRRHRAGQADRRVFCRTEQDGMATLGAYLPAADAALCYSAIDSLARSARTPDDSRTTNQVRADALRDLITTGTCAGGSGNAQGRVAAVVNITVPLPTLTAQLPPSAQLIASTQRPAAARRGGWSPTPGASPARLPVDVDRVGAVDPQQGVAAALDALSDGAPVRWIVTSSTGAALAASASTHRRPAWLEDAVKVRDRTCRAPGCRQPAARCDTDHRIPYPRGKTTAGNLTTLCRHHHRMKTHTAWTYRALPRGGIEWTSPTGHTYRTHPGSWLPPLEPPAWLDEPPPELVYPASTHPCADPPPLEACGPDVHPLVGLPRVPGLTRYDPWAPARTDAPDPLEQDPHDWRLRDALG